MLPQCGRPIRSNDGFQIALKKISNVAIAADEEVRTPKFSLRSLSPFRVRMGM